MREVRVDFNVDDTASSLAALLGRLFGRGAVRPAVVEDLVLDFSSCGYLGPMAVVTLCALRRSAVSSGRQLLLIPPVKPVLAAYCRYAGLLAAFDVGGPPDPVPQVNSTMPVAVFDRALPRDVIAGVVSLAEREMQLSGTARYDLQTCLAELLQNVLDHSQSPIGGVVSARAYQREKEVRFAVADTGIGLQAALASRLGPLGPREAIRKAVTEGVSGRATPHNIGLGLAHLHAIARQTGGQLVLLSGSGYLSHQSGTDRYLQTPTPFPGTIGFVRLPVRDDPPGADEDPGNVWG